MSDTIRQYIPGWIDEDIARMVVAPMMIPMDSSAASDLVKDSSIWKRREKRMIDTGGVLRVFECDVNQHLSVAVETDANDLNVVRHWFRIDGQPYSAETPGFIPHSLQVALKKEASKPPESAFAKKFRVALCQRHDDMSDSKIFTVDVWHKDDSSMPDHFEDDEWKALKDILDPATGGDWGERIEGQFEIPDNSVPAVILAFKTAGVELLDLSANEDVEDYNDPFDVPTTPVSTPASTPVSTPVQTKKAKPNGNYHPWANCPKCLQKRVICTEEGDSNTPELCTYNKVLDEFTCDNCGFVWYVESV